MRHWISFLLALAICVSLCGCARDGRVSEDDMVNPVRFYYAAPDADDPLAFEHDTGALRWEVRDLSTESPVVEQILSMYLEGPQTEGLRSPFPEHIVVEEASVEQGVLSVRFNNAISELNGVKLTIAAACLVYTMTQFDSIEFVQLESSRPLLSELIAVPLEPDDFSFMDDYLTSDQTIVKLYFPNQSGRYLREESRSDTFASDEELPAFVLRQLMEGPRSASASAAFPQGTELLDVQVADGLCVVNLSHAFLENAPQSNLEARLQLLAVVNSLTELSGINYVRLLCQGETVASFGQLTLPASMEKDELAMEAAEPSLVYDATLYVPSGTGEGLAAVPICIRKSAGRQLEADVLNALITYKDKNGYVNAVPDNTAVVSLKVEHGICQLTLNSAFGSFDEDPARMLYAIRSVVATLCAIDTIDRVELKIAERELSSVNISGMMSPEDDWFLP